MSGLLDVVFLALGGALVTKAYRTCREFVVVTNRTIYFQNCDLYVNPIFILLLSSPSALPHLREC